MINETLKVEFELHKKANRGSNARECSRAIVQESGGKSTEILIDEQ
jgi:hypothetical protein